MQKAIVKTTIIVNIVLMCGFALSFAREATIASLFGISSDVDSYIVALQIPVTLFALISVAINSVCIPLYSDIYYNEGEEKANQFMSNLLTSLFAFSSIFALLLFLFAHQITWMFAPGFTDEAHNLSVKMLRMLIPIPILSIISQTYIAVLNVRKSFILPSFTSVILNITIISLLFAYHAKIGIFAACIGELVGTLSYVIIIVLYTRRYFKYHIKFNINDQRLKEAIKMSFPVMWSISAAQVNTIINRAVASYLFVGAISSLGYASKINEVIYTLFLTAISTIIYPLYAESASKHDYEGLSNRVNITLSMYSFFLIPSLLFIIVNNKDVVSLAFGRGKFDEIAITQTSVLLSIYSVGLLFNSFRETITKVFYSLKKSSFPSKNATIGVCINIVLNLTLPFLLGVKGLAIGTSFSSVVIALLLIRDLKKVVAIELFYFYQNLKKIVLSATIGIGCSCILCFIFPLDNMIYSLGLSLLATALLYITAIIVCKPPIMNHFIHMVMKTQ